MLPPICPHLGAGRSGSQEVTEGFEPRHSEPMIGFPIELDGIGFGNGKHRGLDQADHQLLSGKNVIPADE